MSSCSSVGLLVSEVPDWQWSEVESLLVVSVPNLWEQTFYRSISALDLIHGELCQTWALDRWAGGPVPIYLLILVQ
jgi:hypothetical protein